MSSLALPERAATDARSETPNRLLVTVRVEDTDVSHRLYRHIGFLDCHEDGYSFRYVRGIVDQPGFLPLLGFPELERVYTSPEMFPLFAERIMSARRPDREQYLNALDLDTSSEPWEILVRSGGRRAGDTIEVMPEPVVHPDGRTSCLFLVHGVRYRGAEASDAICRLNSGDRLTLRWDRDNPVNPRAVLVLDDGDLQLGYVPDPLVDYVQAVMRQEGHRLTVVRANGPEVGSHLRLLVRIEGRVHPGYRPFDEDVYSCGAA